MFDEWDDDDLNLDEIFGKSQTNSQHAVSSRVTPDVNNSKEGAPSHRSFISNDNSALSRPSTSRTLAEQPVNIFPPSNPSFLKPKNVTDRSFHDSYEKSTKPASDQSSTKRDSRDIPQSFALDSSSSRAPLSRSDPSDLSSLLNRSYSDAPAKNCPPPPSHPISSIQPGSHSPQPLQQRKRSASPSSSLSSSSRQTKRRRSRFPGPAGCLGNADDGDVDDGENEGSDRRATTAVDPSNSSTPPDVDGECLLTLQCLVNSYSRLHSNAKRLLTSIANLDWLSQDLVFGSSLPDERVPLLAVAIKGIQLSTHLTVLRLRDVDGNEMNGIVWNAKVQDELAEKLIPGSSLLLKDASAGCATRALVSQYVLLTQKTIAAAAFVDAESQVKLFANPAVDVVEGDFHRLNSVVDKSNADRAASSNASPSPKPRPSLFQSDFGDKSSPVSSANAPLSRGNKFNSNRVTNRSDTLSFKASSNRGEFSSESVPRPPPPPSSSSSFTFTKPNSSTSSKENASTENLNFDLGCDIDAETLSQMLDDDF